MGQDARLVAINVNKKALSDWLRQCTGKDRSAWAQAYKNTVLDVIGGCRATFSPDWAAPVSNAIWRQHKILHLQIENAAGHRRPTVGLPCINAQRNASCCSFVYLSTLWSK